MHQSRSFHAGKTFITMLFVLAVLLAPVEGMWFILGPRVGNVPGWADVELIIAALIIGLCIGSTSQRLADWLVNHER